MAEEQTFAEVCDSSSEKQRHRRHRAFAGRQHRVLNKEEKQRKNNDARDDCEPERPEAEGTAGVLEDTKDDAGTQLNTFGVQKNPRRDLREYINDRDAPDEERGGKQHKRRVAPGCV